MISKEEKYYLLTFEEDWADEHDVPALDCKNEADFNEWKRSKQALHAYLGNGGDNFCDDEQGSTGAQLLKSGMVKKFVVNKDFYKTFHKADLARLSLCNVFDNEYDDEDEDWKENPMEVDVEDE